MKKITKLLSFAMAIILVVGVLLSAPFTVNAVTFNTYWADSEYFQLPVDGAAMVSSQTAAGTTDHYLVRCNYQTSSEPLIAEYNNKELARSNIIKFSKESGNVSISSKGGNGYVYSTLPYVTMYYYAPHTKEYTIRFVVNGTINRLPIVVNDTKYYVSTRADDNGKGALGKDVRWTAEQTITLDKGAGFIRIILREDHLRNYWQNFHWVEVDDNLTLLKRTPLTLEPYQCYQYNGYYNKSAKYFSDTNTVGYGSGSTYHGNYNQYWEKVVRADGTSISCESSAHSGGAHTFDNVYQAFKPNYGIINENGQPGYYSNGQWVGNSDTDFTNRTSFIPFVSYTVDVAMDGYYDIQWNLSANSNASWEGEIMMAVNDWIYYRNVANYTSGNDAYIALSLFLPAGKNVVTFAAPFSLKKAEDGVTNKWNWMNMHGVKFYAADQPTATGKIITYSGTGTTNQIRPDTITGITNKGALTQLYDNKTAFYYDSGPIYADYAAVFNGIINDAWTTDSQNNPSFGVQHYSIKNDPEDPQRINANTQLVKDMFGGTAPSDMGNHYKVGGLGAVGFYQPVMQSWRSIHEDGYIDKSYMPMVSYQVEVPEGGAGTYRLEANYEVSINPGYSHTDYYQVVSVNDNQFFQSYFVDMCGGINTPCESDAYIPADKQKGDYLRDDVAGESSHFTRSQHYVKLVEGVNVIRLIAAVYETAPMLAWCNQQFIRLEGPGDVKPVAVKNVGTENDTTQYVASHRFSWFDPDVGNNSVSDYINQNKPDESGVGYNLLSNNAEGLTKPIVENINKLARKQYDDYKKNNWSNFNPSNPGEINAPLTSDGITVAVNVWGFNPQSCSGAAAMDGQSGYNNPRQSYYVGGAYYNFNFEAITNKNNGESKYVKGGKYSDLYANLKLTDLVNTPCVRYKFNNTGAPGFHDIDLTYKADISTADLISDERVPYFTVVVLHEGTAPRKYKCKFNYLTASGRGKGEMYDHTANISVYLPDGESDIFIINPLDRSFDLRYASGSSYANTDPTYVLTKNGAPSKNNWCDQGSIRIGAGDVEVYHPADRWEDIVAAMPESDLVCVDGVELLKNSLDNYIKDQTDKEKFLERREWAKQYLTYIIQDYEGHTLNDQGANVQLMEDKIDLEGKLATLEALTYEEACAWVDNTGRNLGNGWEGYIHYLTEVDSVDVEEWVADSEDAERISDADNYFTTSKENAKNNSTGNKATNSNAIGDENKADTNINSDSTKLTVRDGTVAHLNSIRDAFYREAVYDNGWDSIIAYEWEVDACYNDYMAYAEKVIKGTDSFYDLRKEYYDKTTYEQVIDEIKEKFEAETKLKFDDYFVNNLDSAENAANAGRDSVNSARIPFAVKAVIDTCRTDIANMTYKFKTTNATTLDGKEPDGNYASNNELIIKRYQDMLEEVMGRINALRYQMGVWTQYQTEADAQGDKFAYVRLFFEIDPGANNYVNAESVTTNGGHTIELTGPLERTITAELKGQYGFAIYMPWWDNGNPRYVDIVDLSASNPNNRDCKVDEISWNKADGSKETMLPDKYAGDGYFGTSDGYCDFGFSGAKEFYNIYYSSETGKYFVYMYIEVPKRYWGEDFYVFGYCADEENVFVSKREIVNIQYYWDNKDINGGKKTDIYS